MDVVRAGTPVSWGGDGSSCTDGANWSSGVEPFAGDDITIDADVKVNIAATDTITSLLKRTVLRKYSRSQSIIRRIGIPKI